MVLPSARRLAVISAILCVPFIARFELLTSFGSDNCETKTTTIRLSTLNTNSPEDNQPAAYQLFQDGEYIEGGGTPRAFPVWTEPFPCFEPDVNWSAKNVVRSPSKDGFLFVKEMKTGSSTVTGVTLRISQNVAKREKKKYNICKSRFDHSIAEHMKYDERDRQKSFLFTVIREPIKRATSQFFHFGVSREKIEPTDDNFQRYLKGVSFENHYLQTLSTTGYDPNKDEPIDVVNNIMTDYDFIGITERMDESLVALAMILRLELTDVLYLSAKGNGGFDDTCVYIVPSYVSPGMQAYFDENPRWKKLTAGDRALYGAAQKSLDMTIKELGTTTFLTNLAEYKRLKQICSDFCSGKVSFPCDASGRLVKNHGCLWNDSGCGNGCIDGVVARNFTR